MGQYLAGIDVGTTGARCCLFDLEGNKFGGAYCEYGADYPRPGWVEQSPQNLIAQTMQACAETISKSGVPANEIASIAFSTQRSVTCPVDEHGQPVRAMISWQDARTAKQVDYMRSLISPEEYYAHSGLPLGTTWIVSKILWMRDNEPANYERTAKFVQNQDLALRAFGAEQFHTDISDMAFYGVWDTRRCRWNKKLLDMFGLSEEMFGKPAQPGTQVGAVTDDVAGKTGFAVGTPICVGAGDQNCSVIGMGAVKPGMATVTLGTAGLAILATDKPVAGFGGMMITNHAMADMWEVEGLSNAAAGSFRWFRDVIAGREMDKAASSGKDVYALLTELAGQSSPGAKGLLFMPYLATAATPRWNPDARGTILGLTLAHNRADLTRAVMEGVVFEIRDMMQQWHDNDMDVDLIRIGGGATNSVLWNQIQADVYGRAVQVVREKEATALGAAILAGVGAGIFSSIPQGVENMVKLQREITPDAKRHDIYEQLYEVYDKAYNALDKGGIFSSLAAMQS